MATGGPSKRDGARRSTLLARRRICRRVDRDLGRVAAIDGRRVRPEWHDVKAAEAYYEWIHEQMPANRPLNEFVAEQITATGSNLTRAGQPVHHAGARVRSSPPRASRPTSRSCSRACKSNAPNAITIRSIAGRWTTTTASSACSPACGASRVRSARVLHLQRRCRPRRPAPGRRRPDAGQGLGRAEARAAGRRPAAALARWLTSPDNELFARNLANRIWAHHMGRGLVEPLDDMRISNPPTNKPLLDAWPGDLAESRFNLRALVRDICTSRVYHLRRSRMPRTRTTIGNFHAPGCDDCGPTCCSIRSCRLPAANAVSSDFRRGRKPFSTTRVLPATRPALTRRRYLLRNLRPSSRASICSCETKPEPTLSQALHLMAGDTIQGRIGSGVLGSIVAAKHTPGGDHRGSLHSGPVAAATAEEMSGLTKLVGQDVKNRGIFGHSLEPA